MKRLVILMIGLLALSGCQQNPAAENVTATEIPYDIEVVAENLAVPWAIAPSDKDNIYFTERTGAIRKIENGQLVEKPLIVFSDPFTDAGEGGLLGLALDPDFRENHYMYAYYTYVDHGILLNKVVRLIENNHQLRIDRDLVSGIPAGDIHNAGRLKISPDHHMFITTGDANNALLAQDHTSPAGKILRINLDGTIPEDNPFPNSPVYSTGHRDPQGLAWRADKQLYVSEHGQNAHDELNLIVKGGNYGWPTIEGKETAPNRIAPLVESGEETWAPAGMDFISKGPWKGKLLVANLRGQQLLTFSLNKEGSTVTGIDHYLKGQFGRLRDVAMAEDGSIYLSTSNLDGRGIANRGDDKIIRLVPKVVEK